MFGVALSMASICKSLEKGDNSDINVSGNLPLVSDYKKRLSKSGRKTAKSGYRSSEEVDGVVDYCLMCGCSICVNQLPYPKIVFDGFVETGCWKFIRTVRS